MREGRWLPVSRRSRLLSLKVRSRQRKLRAAGRRARSSRSLKNAQGGRSPKEARSPSLLSVWRPFNRPPYRFPSPVRRGSSHSLVRAQHCPSHRESPLGFSRKPDRIRGSVRDSHCNSVPGRYLSAKSSADHGVVPHYLKD